MPGQRYRPPDLAAGTITVSTERFTAARIKPPDMDTPEDTQQALRNATSDLQSHCPI